MSISAHPTDELKQRARKAIVANAFFRIESALTICLTILLIVFFSHPFPWWQWWYWLILGGLSETLIVVTSLTDQATANKVVAMMLRERFDPSQIKTRSYRELVEKALSYRQQLENLISTSPAGVLRDHLYDSTAGIADWIGSIFELAKRLDNYERDDLLRSDMNSAPAEVTRLLRASSTVNDPAVKDQIKSALAVAQEHWNNLRILQNKMEQAQFRLQETVTSLGTVYSQFQLIFAQKLGGSDAQRLTEGIRDQVQRLQDIITTMSEVYAHKPIA
ncbi:MAG: hypothetical protein ACYCZF_00890 [Anaerolineae bacterium]